MIKQLIQKFGTTLFLSSLLVLSACGGGGGGGGGTPATPIGDISGLWNVETVVDRSDCGGGAAERDPDEIVTVTQSGSAITVTDSDGPNTGTLSGNRLSWSGSYPEDGGTTSVSFSLTVAPSCNSLSGTAPWSWSDGTFTCSGTTQVTATRLDPIGCGGDGGGDGGGGGTTIPEVEPNNTAATAQAITLPVTITGNTIGNEEVGGSISNDIDAFSFTVTSTQTVTATLTGGTTPGIDMDLYVTNADGTVEILQSENLFSNESVSGTFVAGTYLVVVWPYDVPSATSYTLSIQ